MPGLSDFALLPSYCNPLPLPDYPRGRLSANKANEWGWMHRDHHDFRETADPSVLYHQGRWYLYPSCGMAYVSEDFVTWTFHPMNLYDVGYAPTIVRFGDSFLLTASQNAPLYRASDPLGPFTEVGPMLDPHGLPLQDWNDPMLFADDDGRLYAYWGIAGPGIFGAELDPTAPNRCLTMPAVLFSFDPGHAWERYGDFNENPERSWIEGPWMFKHCGTYYLTYAGPGTQCKSYGMGAYTAAQPLGPFQYQPRNPILRDTDGLVHGPGHGCIVRGPGDTLWAFYTCLVRNEHAFERRCGMDPAGIDAEGNLFVRGASEIPQWAPGVLAHPEANNDVGLWPVTVNKTARASSEAPGRSAVYAIDNVIRTWWQADAGDPHPWLLVSLEDPYLVSAMRVLWAEPGLDYDMGVLPGPFRYLLEVRGSDDASWQVVLDRSGNQTDLLIEYLTFTETVALQIRLTVLGRPPGMDVGVIELTVFGRRDATPPGSP